MPYIREEDQKPFAQLMEEIDTADVQTPGELNFLITKLMVRYMRVNGCRYQQMNDVVGVLESAKAEFQRRVVNPYEDQKAFELSMSGTDPYAVSR
jgi:hypothetical protein